MRTFIKWEGNKSKYIKKIEPFIPDFDGTYIEPFIGSGAVFLKVQPKKWIINDLNSDLINIWKLVKNNPDYLINTIEKFGEKFEEANLQEQTHLAKKNVLKINKLKSKDKKRAATYLLMKLYSYMGQILRKGKFIFQGFEMNIKNGHYYFLSEKYYNVLYSVSEYLSETKGKIYNKDYKEILKMAKKGDFVFLDPPYQGQFGFNYNKEEDVSHYFIKELKKQVQKLDKKKVNWVMTQGHSKLIKETFKEYEIKSFKVHRAISGKYSTELIITNSNKF